MRRAPGAGRPRVTCPRCGREVIQRRDGGLMAHRGEDGRTCEPPGWRERVFDNSPARAGGDA